MLDTAVLDNIRPFSGTSQEMSAGERIISEGRTLQKIQTQYTTAVAVQQPRSIAKVTKNVLEEAKLAGAAFYYRWEILNKKTGRKSVVQGPSIDLAMCIARNYGNCAVDIEGTETASHYMFKGVFIDLETGFTVPRLFRQRKNQNIGGKYEDDRAEDIVFQIGQSKAQRNAITKAAPGWLVDQAIEEARQAEINKIKPENLHVARGKALDYFATHGVTPERMEAKIGRKADQWTAEDLADLKGSATALKEGRISPEELFPEAEEEKATEADTQVNAAPDIVPPGSAQEAEKKRGRPAGSTNKPKEPLRPEDEEEPEKKEEVKVDRETAIFLTEAIQYKAELPPDEWKKLLDAFTVEDPAKVKTTMRQAFLRTAKSWLDKANTGK